MGSTSLEMRLNLRVRQRLGFVAFQALRRAVEHCFRFRGQRRKVIVEQAFRFLIASFAVAILARELFPMCFHRLVCKLFERFTKRGLFQLADNSAEFGDFERGGFNSATTDALSPKKGCDELPISGGYLAQIRLAKGVLFLVDPGIEQRVFRKTVVRRMLPLLPRIRYASNSTYFTFLSRKLLHFVTHSSTCPCATTQTASGEDNIFPYVTNT